MHAELADAAYRFGPGRPPDTSQHPQNHRYRAALRCRRDTPRIWLLSERAEFAKAVVDAGLIWVGPKSSRPRVARMGQADPHARRTSHGRV
ncbi:biotin carboxylase N-terminal domain-containing protein [Mesorhizobium sp. M0189]|uniref:biotin carboxylase N-terminal domain-containing protein n=1 Tax=Mesorhizobium sp. M0189 TaxID=2956909 RepID=UPI00333A02B0